MLNGFRLSLTTGQSISAEGTTSSTVYMAPHTGGKIELYHGSEWVIHTTAQLSLALGTLATDTNYDVFAYYDNTLSAVVLELGSAWFSAGSRTTNDAITPGVSKFEGVYVKADDSTRRYLGTLRTNSSTTTIDSTAKRFLWNMYNRVDRVLSVVDTTNSWTYAGSAGGPNWRGANASTSNKVEYVTGVSGVVEGHFKAYGIHAAAAATSADYCATPGIGMFSSGSNQAQLCGSCPNSLTLYMTAQAECRIFMSFGYSVVWWLDGNNKSTNTSYLGDNNTTVTQSGMIGTLQG